MIGTPNQAARHFKINPATIRRWIAAGCPVIRSGRKGPGQSAILDFQAVEQWRGQSVQAEPDVNETLQRIAQALHAALEEDHADIRAGISREDAAAVLIVAWERLCKTFGKNYRFDQQPDPIRALAREL